MEYTETHEWIDYQGTIATVGLSDKAQKELGEIVYLDLPEIGSKAVKDEAICVLESTKAAVDLYAPLSGKIIAINDSLKNQPEMINSLPEKEKWLYKVDISL